MQNLFSALQFLFPARVGSSGHEPPLWDIGNGVEIMLKIWAGRMTGPLGVRACAPETAAKFKAPAPGLPTPDQRGPDAVGPPGIEIEVPGLAVEPTSEDPEPPTHSGALQPIAAEVLM